MSAMAIVDDLEVESPEPGFDFAARVDSFRMHSTAELRRMFKENRKQRERLRLDAMAMLRVFDDRDDLAQVRESGTDPRSTKADVATARELESRPAIAAAAHAGELTLDQVRPLVELSTPETDREWAQRARNIQPGDLDRMVRRRRTLTSAEVAERRSSRHLTTWRDDEQGMVAGRFWLPDLDGVLVEKVLDHMAERMRPEKGQPWDSLAHRKADALVELCRSYADVRPTGRFRYEIVNIVDPNATSFGAEVAGIPLAPEQLNALVPMAKVRDCSPTAAADRPTLAHAYHRRAPAPSLRSVGSSTRVSPARRHGLVAARSTSARPDPSAAGGGGRCGAIWFAGARPGSLGPDRASAASEGAGARPAREPLRSSVPTAPAARARDVTPHQLLDNFRARASHRSGRDGRYASPVQSGMLVSV